MEPVGPVLGGEANTTSNLAHQAATPVGGGAGAGAAARASETTTSGRGPSRPMRAA